MNEENIISFISSIAKKIVKTIGENPNCEKEGNCANISIEIKNALDKNNIQSDVIQVISGKIPGENLTHQTHFYVFVYDGNLIVDTQLWQINKQPQNLNDRQVVFTYDEYNKFFQPHETKKLTLFNEQKKLIRKIIREKIEEQFNTSDKTFWAWISPDNQLHKVPKLNHKDFIMRKYKDEPFGWDYDRVFIQAMKDGWVRVIYEYFPDRFKSELSLNGETLERVKSALTNKLFDLVKYGNNTIYIESETPKFSKYFSTFSQESKNEFLNFALS